MDFGRNHTQGKQGTKDDVDISHPLTSQCGENLVAGVC